MLLRYGANMAPPRPGRDKTVAPGDTLRRMRRRSIVLVALLVTTAAIDVRVQQQAAERQEKPENFSPLGFEDLRAYEQAFPGLPGSVEVARASAARYWVF